MRYDRPAPGEELNRGEVTEPRPAASLILLRDGPDDPEVLLVERNPEQRFMGGAWVFPGGAVDGDAEEPAPTAVRELYEEAGIRLPPDAPVEPFSRWITPAQVRVRFDTWFFVSRAPRGARPIPDGTECVDARWMRPSDALEAYSRGELTLVFPTIKHLEQLTEFDSVASALQGARVRRVMPVEPRVLEEGGVARVVLPGDPGYEG
ncbi:MAG TPA: NUDIX hydrolase [Thermoleophilaceae bacterium]|nr:NUDIX hydrolase [Thermoleophilaceae bacterium]